MPLVVEKAIVSYSDAYPSGMNGDRKYALRLIVFNR